MTTQISLADILTTSASVASYLGMPGVEPAHLQHAIALLLEEVAFEDIGPPRSPLVPRPAPGPAAVPVRDLAQRWLAQLDNDPARLLTDAELRSLRADVAVLIKNGSSS